MAKGSQKKVTYIPNDDYVLIKPIEEKEAERKTAAGIIIPATVSEEKQGKHGIVVAVGPGKYDEKGERIPLDIKAKDEVFFRWGDEITIDGEEYHVVSASNILLKVAK